MYMQEISRNPKCLVPLKAEEEEMNGEMKPKRESERDREIVEDYNPHQLKPTSG